MPKLKTPAHGTVDVQELKARLEKIARKIGKRKKMSNAQVFDLVFNTR